MIKSDQSLQKCKKIEVQNGVKLPLRGLIAKNLAILAGNDFFIFHNIAKHDYTPQTKWKTDQKASKRANHKNIRKAYDLPTFVAILVKLTLNTFLEMSSFDENQC